MQRKSYFVLWMANYADYGYGYYGYDYGGYIPLVIRDILIPHTVHTVGT